MTSHTTLRALLAPIVEREAGRITTHYETCYQWHVGCLAALVSDLLATDAEPTPATITAERRERIVEEVDAAACWPATPWNPPYAELSALVDAMLDASGIEVSR